MIIEPNSNIQWIIYGGENCPHCINSKKTLELLQIQYIYYDIGKKENGDFLKFFNYFHEKEIIPKEHRTIPVIFHYGKFIGGYTQLCSLLSKMEHDDNDSGDF